MSYIDQMIEHATNFQVDRRNDSVSFSPIDRSDASLESFQLVVRELRANNGKGYIIHRTHAMSDRPGNLIDLVLVTIEHG